MKSDGTLESVVSSCLSAPPSWPPPRTGSKPTALCPLHHGPGQPFPPAPPWDPCHPYPKCPQQQTPNALQPFTTGGSLGLEVGTARGHDRSPALSWADDWEKGLLHMLIQVPSMFQSGGCNPWEDTCPHKVGMLGPWQGEINFPAPGWNLPCSFCTASGILHSGAGTFPTSMGTCEESLAFDPLHWCPYSRWSEEGWLSAATLPDVRIQKDQHLQGCQVSKGAWSNEKQPRVGPAPPPAPVPPPLQSLLPLLVECGPSSGCSELHPFAPAHTRKHIFTPRAVCTGAETLSRKHFSSKSQKPEALTGCQRQTWRHMGSVTMKYNVPIKWYITLIWFLYLQLEGKELLNFFNNLRIINLSPSDLVLKAGLIFLKRLVSLKPGRPVSESTQLGTRKRSGKMWHFVHPVMGSRQVNAHCSTPLPLALLGPRSEEDCLKRNNILLQFPHHWPLQNAVEAARHCYSRVRSLTAKQEPRGLFLAGKYFLFGSIRKHMCCQKKLSNSCMLTSTDRR